MDNDTPVVDSRDGKVIGLQESYLNNTGGPNGEGNYVMVQHLPTTGSCTGGVTCRVSLYYHLDYNGALVGNGDVVSAGQQIALSGNTGNSSDPHLHYQLMSGTCQTNACDEDPRLWTTDPGRLPYKDQFIAQSQTGTIHIVQGSQISFWIQVKNLGGQTWTTTNDPNGFGRIILLSTDSGAGASQVASPFRASDWESSTVVGVADQASVAPDATATFSFHLSAPATLATGTYSQYFNLKASSLFPFWRNNTVWHPLTIVVDPYVCPTHGQTC